jgi:hypothetical protein
MEYLRVLLTSALAAAAVLAAAGGCSGPDPGGIIFSERQGATGESASSSSSSSSSSGSTGGEGGGGGGGDGGGGPADPIFGTAAFAWVDPGQVANTAGGANHPGQKVEGADCLVDGCHKAGGKPWLMGGTVYTAATGGTTVPKAEIRILGPDNKEIAKTYTDANGNFWFEAPGATIPAGAKVGVRREGGAGTKIMATALGPADGGCNRVTTCHGGPPQGRIFVP